MIVRGEKNGRLNDGWSDRWTTMQTGPNPTPPDPQREEEIERHADQLWELELADQVHGQFEAAHRDHDSRLQHHIRVLRECYGKQTPENYPLDRLISRADQLAHRYRRIARRTLRLIRTDTRDEFLARPCLRECVAWQVYFKSACDARDEIKQEMEESIRYWQWVREHKRLPLRIALRLGRFNHRPIAHPWESISASGMEVLGLVEKRLHV